ncbi:hypothetical protein WJX72_007730 [[Myrmecia] bisecta]|uniref:Uncharacterized protein n=1 Tax=[Myrmecia] bisecta TaxID=41462 RepID=A0AAW1Q2I7_9CHLO
MISRVCLLGAGPGSGQHWHNGALCGAVERPNSSWLWVPAHPVGSCADHVGCTACEEGYFLAKKMLPASGESMQVCNSCARLHCPAGACEDHVGCTSCPMSKRYPNYFLAKHEDAFLAPTVKSCHACSGHFCKRGGCENDVGCTDCPAGFALTRSPEFHSAGTTPLESCRPCKALGCKPSECEEDVGCTACPHGRFLHHDKTLGANVCTSCSALQCPAGDPDSCEDGVGCLYCDSRHYLHYDENPRVNAWRCIKCIDDFNCSKCGKPFFLSTFNNSESTMYCAHCEHKHCKSPSAGDCVARYSAEEYHPQDPQYFPRQAQALTNFGCSACLPGDFAIIRHGVWDCRYNARAHNCGEGAYGSSLHDLSGCRGCPPEHFEGLRLEETISYQPFIERGNPTNLTFVHCRNRCEQFGCKDCDRIYPEGDQLEGVVWKPDGEFWWDSVNTVADVYCYTCLPGKTRTGDGRCVEPCPEADHVRLEDGSCRAASSCKEGMLLNAKGTCVTKCEVGFRYLMPSHRQAKAHKLTWWQKAGQNFNSAGIILFFQVLLGNQSLAVPHVDVPDITWVDWQALKSAGFQGCVFDKDNTLTEPYATAVHPRLAPALQECSRAFDGRLVLFSNSAGLRQFDPKGEEAKRLEAALSIPVLRHTEKKPAGGTRDMEAHFGCRAEQLIMIGDRTLTDIVFGNRNGMLTIRPAPLTSRGEPWSVRVARRIEELLANHWRRQRVQPPQHPLVTSRQALVSFTKDPGVW